MTSWYYRNGAMLQGTVLLIGHLTLLRQDCGGITFNFTSRVICTLQAETYILYKQRHMYFTSRDGCTYKQRHTCTLRMDIQLYYDRQEGSGPVGLPKGVEEV